MEPDPAVTGAPPARSPGRSGRGRFFPLRENVRQIVAAVVVVLFVRHFVVEIFKIPTGSMASTLYGTHVRVECPRCGWEYTVGAPRGNVTEEFLGQSANCPSCGEANRLSDFRDHGGHKIIANKWVYRLREPRRWEVVVFRFFDERRKPVNYIKRLVGLPGERLEIRHGDLYINGALAGKPHEVQEAIWIPVYDSRFENAWLEGFAAAFGWSRAGSGWRLESPEAPSELTFLRPIRNELAYNHGEASSPFRERDAVGDLRLTLSARLEGTESFLEGTLREDDSEFGVRLAGRSSGGASVFWRRAGSEEGRWLVTGWTPPMAREFEVRFANCDDRLTLTVDGKVVFERKVEGTVYSEGRDSGVGISGRGRVDLARVRIDRDLYYIPNGLPGFDIPPGEYFFLGDNSNNSNDSRTWTSRELGQYHTVKRERILGKASYALLYVELDWPWRLPWKRLEIREVR